MRTPIYKGRVIDLGREHVTLPTGVEVDLDIIVHPGASAIVALDGDGAVTLIRQYRHAAGGYIWEVPAGTLDAGESPEICASRELIEEAGLQAKRWTPLGHVFTVPGFCTEKIHLFLAEELEQVGAATEEDEDIAEVRQVPLEQALAWIEDGTLSDAKSIAALFRASRCVQRRSAETS